MNQNTIWDHNDLPLNKEKSIKLLLAEPRGFCAGVDRAIKIVEETLEAHGAPVYVRHEIVHNKFVVDRLRAKGVIFVETLDEVDQTDRPVIFSAHGVAKSVVETAKFRHLFYIDATCPLVSKVHRETEKHHKAGHFICLIGHENHPEVIGTMGQIPSSSIALIETEEDACAFVPPSGFGGLAYVTQTTLSMDDTASIIDILKKRFPGIHGPQKSDICYATTNRQQAVKAMAERCDYFFVVGSHNSSNAKRLVEVALKAGSKQAFLLEKPADIDAFITAENAFGHHHVIGLSAGASTPEILVQEVINRLKSAFHVDIENIITAKETTIFRVLSVKVRK